jgi:hypothetical protein
LISDPSRSELCLDEAELDCQFLLIVGARRGTISLGMV